MNWNRQSVIPYVVGIALVIVSIVLSIELFRARRVSVLVGSVLQQDADPNRQVPLANAKVTVTNEQVKGECQTDSSGLFRLQLHPSVPVGEMLMLRVDHSNYQSLTIAARADTRIYVARMNPLPPEGRRRKDDPVITISGIRVRYAEKITTTGNVGSVAKTFQVVNTGNVPCVHRSLCSPDGKWKANVGGATFDAGDGNEFRNVRVSCIAGPCPFSKIEKIAFSSGRRRIDVSARAWSDTVTYLVEAEVMRTALTDTVRYLYPVNFGRSMSFALPPGSQGPSIEAELGGKSIVFPLGPALVLSWAHCSVQTAPDRSKLYRCDLYPGYRFQ